MRVADSPSVKRREAAAAPRFSGWPAGGAIDMDKSRRSLKVEWSLRVPGSPVKIILDLARREPMVVAAIVLFLAFAATSPVFGSLGNAENILRQTAPVLLLGLGMTFVVLVGGIDLSVGSVVIAAAAAAGIVLVSGLPSGVAMVAALTVGAGVGAINALLIEALRISPVIVTLGSMIAVRGLALSLLGEYSSWITIK